MTTDVLTVREGTPFKDVARALSMRDVSAVPVIDRDGRVVVVVSEADLLIKQGTQELDFTRSLLTWLRGRRNLRRAHRDQGCRTDDQAGGHGLCRHHRRPRRVADDRAQRETRPGRGRGRQAGRGREPQGRADRVPAVNPATVPVTVHESEATLTGQVELRSQVALVEEMTRHIDGVVDVAVSMGYRHDDTKTGIPDPMAVDITRSPRMS